MPIVTVDGEGQVTIELEKLVPLRDLIHIRGTFTEIVKEENQIEHTEDFVYVTLSEEEMDMMKDVAKEVGIYEAD